jgi:hypothetical protein
MEKLLLAKLDKINVRKDDCLCTDCGGMEPIHPGNGTPASAFIMALRLMAERHMGCSVASRKKHEPSERK